MRTDKTIKLVRKPTPVKSAVLWVSLTSNAFMAVLGYAIYNGQLARTEVAPQQVALYGQGDYVTQLAQGGR